MHLFDQAAPVHYRTAADWDTEFDAIVQAVRDDENNAIVGRYLRSKYRRILSESGDYYAAARNLRKQGFPLAIARLVLFGRA